MKNRYLIILFVLIAQIANAQFPADSMLNYMVDDKTGSEQVTPLSERTIDGYTYISWFDNSSGQYNLRMQRLNIDGVPQWAQGGIIVSSLPQNSALFRYDLDVDYDGNAIVAFQDERTGSLQVVAYKISTAGTSVWGSGIVLQDSTSDGLSPRITVTNSNDVIIAWNASLGSAKWVAYSKISSGGQQQWIKRIWNNQKYSRAVMLPAGTTGFQMLYVQEVGNFPGVTCTMYYQRFDSSGTALLTNAVQVSNKVIPFFFFPEIISDKHDGVYVAFNTGNPSNAMMNDVYAQRVDSAGNTWSATGTECANSTTEHKLTGAFVTNDTGSELFVLLQVLDGSQGSSGISLQKLDNTGTLMLGTNALNLHPISATYYLPVGMVYTQTGLMMAYLLGGFGNQILHGMSTDYNGLPVWGYDPAISAVLSNKDDVTCTNYQVGGMVVVWSDDRIDGGVYAQNIFLNGGMGPTVSIEEQSLVREAVLFPDPSAYPKLRLNAERSENLILKIINPLGQMISVTSLNVKPGVNELVIPQVGKGIYRLVLSTKEEIVWQQQWINE